jgi:hypothetical protein
MAFRRRSGECVSASAVFSLHHDLTLGKKKSSRAFVESVIMAYAVDLISVLKSLLDFTLRKPDSAENANWEILKNAFEAYAKDFDLEQNHTVCRSTFQQNNQTMPLNREAFRAKIKELLKT